MAENTKIQWADHTFNPWIGCTKVSAGCDNCYAERDWGENGRRKRVVWGAGNPRSKTSESNWKLPLTWNRKAEKSGTRPRVFCASLSDVFDPEAPSEWRFELFSLIAKTPSLDWLLLTKRPANAKRFYDVMPRNIWMGTSIEDQDAVWARARYLADWPGIKFWSCEPLLGRIHMPASVHALMPDWVIAGGESGPNSRPMDDRWARSLLGQCIGSGTAFFMKQMSGNTAVEREAIPEHLMVREFPAQPHKTKVQ